MKLLNARTIDALALIISGGSDSGHHVAPEFSRYRRAGEIKRFLSPFGIEYELAGRSRVPVLIDRLEQLNNDPHHHKTLVDCICASVTPIDYVHDEERLGKTLEYLNEYLKFDGLQIRVGRTSAEVVKIQQVIGSEGIRTHSKSLSLDTVQRDFDRALESAAVDPEDAITAACSMLESILRSIIVGLDATLPAKKDLSSLYKTVRDNLNLSPERSDLPKEISDDVKTILGGLTTIVGGIGSLRTHAGDAHGREAGHTRVDARIAQLAVNSANTLGVFLIETWQMKFPSVPLEKHKGVREHTRE